MKTKFPVSICVLVALLGLSAFFLGCGSKGTSTINIVANNASMAAGMTTQLHAIESVNSQGTDVTTSVTWTSSNPAVATVSATGLLTGVTQGSANISAVLNQANGSLAVAITAAAVSSVAVTPPNTPLVTGGTQQYTLTATNSDNSTTNVTSSTTWNVTPASVASINASGLLTAVGPGSFALTATYGTFSAAAVGTVTASALTAIAVTPATANVSERRHPAIYRHWYICRRVDGRSQQGGDLDIEQCVRTHHQCQRTGNGRSHQ